MDRLTRIRRWLLAVLLLGMAGTSTDLLLLSHYEDRLQLIPLALLAGGLLAIAWHLSSRGRVSLRVLEAVMALFLVAGVAGVALHASGSAEFQREIDPGQSAWAVAVKVARAKAPPTLAPGVMIVLGLVGLTYTVHSRSGS